MVGLASRFLPLLIEFALQRQAALIRLMLEQLTLCTSEADMDRIVVNVASGDVEVIQLTQEEIAEIQSRAPEIPYQVDDLQFRLALNQLGLRDSVESYVSGASQDVKDYWDRATTFRRDHPLVVGAGVALGKTDAEMDALFQLAATL
jgi:hypothetical protein